MSLYTPVFPPTDPPVARTASSSSLSSTDTTKPIRGLSYSSRLSQWHLAIASLPDELCPPSAPSSPGSQERSAKLQADIESAVRDGRNITDLCKLRSTGLGYATRQPVHNIPEHGDGVPWILAETEEEWLEWEKKRARRRGRQKGKERMTPAPPPTQSQNAHYKVLNWKAGLQPTTSLPVTVSAAPSASTARSSLGFPVVKRSAVHNGKLKTARPATPLDAAPRPKPEGQNIGEGGPVLQVETNAIHVDTGDAEHSTCFSGLRRAASDPPAEAKEEDLVPNEPENAQLEVYDISALPPSFPSDLITSTQKDVFGMVRPVQGPSSSLPLNLPVSTLKDEGNAIADIIVYDQDEPQAEKLPNSEVKMTSDELGIEPRGPLVPQPTPPSPPYSSATSQPIEQTPATPVNPESTSAEGLLIPTTPPRGNVRPLTPPPEVIAPVWAGMQASPRTPPRRTLSRLPSEKYLNVPRGEVYGGAAGGSIMVKSGPTTPDAAINGAIGIGAGFGLPRTPERQRQVLTDPLTTSRKSLPRPRPPSRKHSIQNMDMDIDGAAAGMSGGGDPSPAKSDRSYFSSPASGSSSGSDLSRSSMRLIPGSPTSPLGFTQNPHRFAPDAVSTQVPRGPLRSRSRLGLSSEGQTQTQSRSQKSFGVGYNSQFDVDAQVDRVSHFMRQDVDLDAWVRHADADVDVNSVANTGNTDDEDAVAVEELTMPRPASPLGSY